MGTYHSLIDCSYLATVPWLAQALCWTTILLEAGCVLFVWHLRIRKLWFAGLVGMHLGIALAVNLWTFSATMVVFDIAAFGILRQADLRKSPATPSVAAHGATSLETNTQVVPCDQANQSAAAV